MGIPLRTNMGKYLGHYIAQSGNNRVRHKELLQRVHARADGWKLCCLSRTGRLTLAQSVFGSLPIFYMQMERLPAWVHAELDKTMRRCVWGTNGGGRGVHLLRWETLCLPKKHGGANLKPAKDMNQAMLVKLNWKLLTRMGNVWCSVLVAKYKIKEGDGAHFKVKQRASNVWRGVLWGADLLRKGLRWSVGNGRTVSFWKEIWLCDTPLCDTALGHLGVEELECKVVHYWESEIGWKWELLQDKISFVSLVRFASVVLGEDDSRADRAEWAFES